MKTIKFKTDIKCTGCLEKVSPFLDEVVGKNNWEVAILTPEKILTVSTENVETEKIIEAAKKAGYTITEQLN